MAFEQQRFGKYRLLRRIAAGGMGEVHLAKLVGPAGFEKLVVIKRLLEQRRSDAKYVEMFFSEARVAAQLTHSNIAQVYETGDVDSVPYIAMEYVHGKSLRKILDQAEALGARGGEPRVPVAFIGRIIAQLCRGLAFAHDAHHLSGAAMGLIHRDINPLNVLVSYQGEVKIIDFGIAKSELNLDKTQAGTIKGTVVYMSPEQSLGHTLDKRSDMFSVGICLYEALAGKNPFHKGTLGASLDAIRRASAPPLDAEARPELAPFNRILQNVLRARPEERFVDCTALADEIEAVLSSGVLSRPTENLSGYMRRLFASDIRDEETSLERTDAASLEDLAAPPPARGGTHVLPERQNDGTNDTPLDGERTSGGKPVAQVSSVHAHMQGARVAAQAGVARKPSGAETDPLNEEISESDQALAEEVTGQAKALDEPAGPSAELSQGDLELSGVVVVQDEPPSPGATGEQGVVKRLTAAIEERAPFLSGFLHWGQLVPGRPGGRFGLPVVLAAFVLLTASALALWLGRKQEGPSEMPPVATTPSRPSLTGRQVPSFLEGEIDEATQQAPKRYKEDKDPLHLLDEDVAPMRELPGMGVTPQRRSTKAPAAPSAKKVPSRDGGRHAGARVPHTTGAHKRPLMHPESVHTPVASLAPTPTMRLRADPPLSLMHNGQFSQNPVKLHDGSGIIELRGGPGGHTFVIRISYESVKRDVSFTIDSEPWADVYGAGGMSLGRTPVKLTHAGDSTALVLKNPRFKTAQHLTVKLTGQAIPQDE